MNSNNCKILKEQLINLYCNAEGAISRFIEFVPQLQHIIDEIIENIPEELENIQKYAGDLEKAVSAGDILRCADDVYCIYETYLRTSNVQNCEIESSQGQLENVDEQVQIENYYEKNISAMENAKMNIYNHVIEECSNLSEKDSKDIVIDKNGNIGVYREEVLWRLNSYKNRYEVSEFVCDYFEKKGYISQLYILGIANMNYINAILKVIPQDTVVYIYEPNSNIFNKNLHYRDMSKIFTRKYTFLFVEGINDRLMTSYVDSFANSVQTEYLYTFVSPNYNALYLELLKKTVSQCSEAMNIAIMTENTIVDRADKINYARIMNLRILPETILLSEFKNVCRREIAVEHVPAIIVAAGPSLDYNIRYLKQAEGKAFIIAVDSAIRMLDQYNIKPNIYITLDPIKPDVLFHNETAEKTPLLYCEHSKYESICKLKGKKIFCNIDNFANSVLKELGKEEELMSAGGSVSNTAYAVAQYIGFKNVIVIGLDLAFQEERKHASVVYDEKKVNQEEYEDYTYVMGNNGKQLLTYKNFKAYKEWFEHRIKKDCLNFINATEGGALIEGSICMTLEDAINKYCKTQISIENVINQCQLAFNQSQKEAYKKLIVQLQKDSEEMGKKYQECLKLYENISNSKDITLIKKNMHQINQIDEFLKKFIVNTIIRDYAAAKSDSALKKMYANSKQQKDQWIEVWDNIQSGIVVTKALIEGAEMAVKNFEECLKEI